MTHSHPPASASNNNKNSVKYIGSVPATRGKWIPPPTTTVLVHSKNTELVVSESSNQLYKPTSDNLISSVVVTTPASDNGHEMYSYTVDTPNASCLMSPSPVDVADVSELSGVSSSPHTCHGGYSSLPISSTSEANTVSDVSLISSPSACCTLPTSSSTSEDSTCIIPTTVNNYSTRSTASIATVVVAPAAEHGLLSPIIPDMQSASVSPIQLMQVSVESYASNNTTSMSNNILPAVAFLPLPHLPPPPISYVPIPTGIGMNMNMIVPPVVPELSYISASGTHEFNSRPFPQQERQSHHHHHRFFNDRPTQVENSNMNRSGGGVNHGPDSYQRSSQSTDTNYFNTYAGRQPRVPGSYEKKIELDRNAIVPVKVLTPRTTPTGQSARLSKPIETTDSNNNQDTLSTNNETSERQGPVISEDQTDESSKNLTATVDWSDDSGDQALPSPSSSHGLCSEQMGTVSENGSSSLAQQELMQLMQLQQMLLNSPSNVYIRGLPPNTTDEILLDMCRPYGSVVSAKSIIDLRNQRQCKGYGFVFFEVVEDAEYAIEQLNKLGFQCSIAKESFSAKLKTLQDQGSTNIYISNLPLNMTEKDLEELFAPLKIVSSRVLYDEHNTSRGVGFARMIDRESALGVIARFNHATLVGCSSPLQVRFADSPAQKRLKSINIRRKVQRLYINPSRHSPMYPNSPATVIPLGLPLGSTASSPNGPNATAIPLGTPSTMFIPAGTPSTASQNMAGSQPGMPQANQYPYLYYSPSPYVYYVSAAPVTPSSSGDTVGGEHNASLCHTAQVGDAIRTSPPMSFYGMSYSPQTIHSQGPYHTLASPYGHPQLYQPHHHSQQQQHQQSGKHFPLPAANMYQAVMHQPLSTYMYGDSNGEFGIPINATEEIYCPGYDDRGLFVYNSSVVAGDRPALYMQGNADATNGTYTGSNGSQFSPSTPADNTFTSHDTLKTTFSSDMHNTVKMMEAFAIEDQGNGYTQTPITVSEHGAEEGEADLQH